MNKNKTFSLKIRVTAIFIVVMLVFCLLLAFLTSYTLQSIVKSTVSEAYAKNLNQFGLSFDSIITNINHVSQQLIAQSFIGEKYQEYLETEDAYTKTALQSEIKAFINVITFTNPDVGFTVYIENETELYMFENQPFDQIRFDDLSLIESYPSMDLFGIHQSQAKYTDYSVVSIIRHTEIDGQQISVYIESGFYVLDQLLHTFKEEDSQIYLLITDSSQTVMYSELSGLPLGTNINDSDIFGKGFYSFRYESNQGWSIYSLVPVNEFRSGLKNWYVQILILFALFAGICLALFMGISKTIYSPLKQMDRVIEEIIFNDSPEVPIATNISEFQYLFSRINDMRDEISYMLERTKQQEQLNSKMEVEKLRAQINPHFVMNTLNTVHWLCVMQKQPEIDKLVMSLNKMLSYNLDKSSRYATLYNEIKAVKDYLTIQLVQYDFTYDIQEEGETSRILCPKFILQPFVENALLHGYRENMHINIQVIMQGNVHITVSDDGTGMTAEQVEQISREYLNTENNRLGIGISYVYKVLTAEYGTRSSLHINGIPGAGTTVDITFPINREGEQSE